MRRLPLMQGVHFKVVLQVGGRFQVPNVVRWEFKMDPEQVLFVSAKIADQYRNEQSFYGKMRSDGRITIPKRLLKLVLLDLAGSKSSRKILLEVSLDPVRKPVPEKGS